MLLSELFLKLNGIFDEAAEFKAFGNSSLQEFSIERISSSSKDAGGRVIFACIKGERFDGNEFINEAYDAGTRVFLTERENLKIKSGIAIISKNARKTMAEIAKILFEVPKGAMLTVGITGTKGKSTVCEILAKTLRTLGVKTLSVGSFGAYFEKALELKNTTPDASVLFPLIKEAYDGGASVSVIEVSSQALKDSRVFGIDFDIVAFTSFGIDHVGRGEHENLCDYISAKRSLFTSFGASLAVINADDAYSAYFSCGVPEIIRCGSSSFADYKIRNIVDGFFGMRFSLSGTQKSYSLPGRFNATNIAIAAAIAERITKEPLEKILEIISKIKLKGRFECYNVLSRFAIIDYAHNEKSLREMLLSIRNITKRRIITVFGSVGDRSKNRRRELSRVASRLSDFSVITSDNPGFENPYEIAEEIYSFFEEKERAAVVVNRAEAIRYAFSKSKPGDVILLIGKGHEEYMLRGGKREKFSEREILNRIKKEGV